MQYNPVHPQISRCLAVQHVALIRREGEGPQSEEVKDSEWLFERVKKYDRGWERQEKQEDESNLDKKDGKLDGWTDMQF